MNKRTLPLLTTFTAACLLLASFANAQELAGTTPVTTGGPSVVPTLTLANPGTFLAQATDSGAFLNLSTFLVTDYTMQEAVYRNSNGSIDFYFQVKTTFNGQSSTQSILDVLGANFGTYATNVGFRPDGSALVGASNFTLGTVAPISASRGPDIYNNNSVFFGFAPGFLGGLVSDVLIVSTNASDYRTIGDMGVDSGGMFNSSITSDLSFYSPSGTVVAAPVAAPEGGSSALLLGLALAGLCLTQRSLRRRVGLNA